MKAIVIDKLKKQFDIFDTDKSGIIEYEEFQVARVWLLCCARSYWPVLVLFGVTWPVFWLK